MTEINEKDVSKTPKKRSPPYPSISLDKAIERARSLYEKAMHHPVKIGVIAAAWDYAPKSSGLFGTLAAMKQFGLLDDEGSTDKRSFRLTERALRIIRDPNPSSEKRVAAIKASALEPKIHQELWEQYGAALLTGSLDMAATSYLTVDRSERGEAPYYDDAAAGLLEEFKKTAIFAGLDSSHGLSNDDQIGDHEANLQYAIGDLINWESSGQIQWKQPRKIISIGEKDGERFYQVEDAAGQKGWIPVEQAIEHPQATPPAGSAFAPPPADPEDRGNGSSDIKVKVGSRKAVFPIDEGDVTLIFPEKLSADGLEELGQYLNIFLKKEQKKARDS